MIFNDVFLVSTDHQQGKTFVTAPHADKLNDATAVDLKSYC